MLAILALLALAGCGGSDKKSSGGSGSTKTTAGPQATATSPGGKPAAAPEKALAARTGTIDGEAVQLEIVELKRGGDSTALTLRLSKQASGGAQVGGTFDDGLFEKLKNSDNSIAGGNTLDGISLIDSKNRKRYLVGRDSNNACVCDVDLSSAFVYPDSPLLLSASFGAPPADVTSVDVAVPRFGTFKDVPLS
jgi:hypothetical protein